MLKLIRMKIRGIEDQKVLRKRGSWKAMGLARFRAGSGSRASLASVRLNVKRKEVRLGVAPPLLDFAASPFKINDCRAEDKK